MIKKLYSGIGFSVLFGLAGLQVAHAYPTKPIKMIVPQAAGGGSDTIARFMAEKLSASLGQPVVVENRPGGGGLLGAEVAKRATADGYTLLLGTIDTITSPIVSGRTDFDAVKDFTPVTKLSESPNVWISSMAFDVDSMADFVEAAKNKPKQIDFASAGVGTTQHLGGALLSQMANIEIGHVPYKGGPPGFVDVLGGRMPMILSGFQGALPHIKTNSVKALAVTSKTRAAALPDTPTVAEALNLPDYEVLNWQGLFFPVNTPEAIVERIAAEVKEILAQDDTKQRLESFGYVPVGSTPTEFKEMVETEQKIWADIIKSANISKQF